MVSLGHVNSEPMLTAIIPCYNEQERLPFLLESIHNQTFKDFKVIVYDNCSTDSTREVLEDFAKKYSNFQMHLNDSNLGLLENFRLSLELCQSRFFVWLGAHDEISPNYFESLIEELLFDESLALAYGKTLAVQVEGEGEARTLRDLVLENNESPNYIFLPGLTGLERYFNNLGNSRQDTARMHGVFRTSYMKAVAEFPWYSGGIDHVILSRASYFGMKENLDCTYYRMQRDTQAHKLHKTESARRFFPRDNHRYYHPRQTFAPLVNSFVQDFFRLPESSYTKLKFTVGVLRTVKVRFGVKLFRNYVLYFSYFIPGFIKTKNCNRH